MTDIGESPILIRSARPEDAARLRELAMSAGIDAWSEAGYADEISNPNSVVLCAFREHAIVGLLVSRIVPGSSDLPDAEIYNIAVDLGWRRSGIGSQLLAELIARLMTKGVEKLWLEVRESNRFAIGFYERHGFTAEITRPHFYANPDENAIVMRLRLTSMGKVTCL